MSLTLTWQNRFSSVSILYATLCEDEPWPVAIVKKTRDNHWSYDSGPGSHPDCPYTLDCDPVVFGKYQDESYEAALKAVEFFIKSHLIWKSEKPTDGTT